MTNEHLNLNYPDCLPMISASKSKLQQLNWIEIPDIIDNCQVGDTPLDMTEYILSDRLSSKCIESDRFSDYEGSSDG